MSKPIKIACLGEVMLELVAGAGADATLGVAGDTFNTAVYLRRLLRSEYAEIFYVTALGNDPFSNRILSQIVAHRLSTEFVERRPDHMPGLYAIETNEQGERSFSYWRGQSAARTLFQKPCRVDLEMLSAFDIIYLSGISMAILPPEIRTRLIEFLTEFRKQGGKFVYDSNHRPRLWESKSAAQEINMKMWSIADIALPSIDDEMDLFDDMNEEMVTKRLIGAGVKFGALKRGVFGPRPFGAISGPIEFSPIESVVDTTAAGDSFNAGFLAGYLESGKLDDALMKGHNLAAKVIQAPGAIVDV